MMTECRHSILGNPHAHVDDAREYRLGKLPEDVDFATLPFNGQNWKQEVFQHGTEDVNA